MPHSTKLRFNSSQNKKKYNLNEFYKLETEACYSTPSILPNVSRIIAIGDLHGDLSALIHALRKAKVIGPRGEWIGKDTVVVQVGDVLDRGGRGVSVPSTEELEEVEIKVV